MPTAIASVARLADTLGAKEWVVRLYGWPRLQK